MKKIIIITLAMSMLLPVHMQASASETCNQFAQKYGPQALTVLGLVVGTALLTRKATLSELATQVAQETTKIDRMRQDEAKTAQFARGELQKILNMEYTADRQVQNAVKFNFDQKNGIGFNRWFNKRQEYIATLLQTPAYTQKILADPALFNLIDQFNSFDFMGYNVHLDASQSLVNTLSNNFSFYLDTAKTVKLAQTGLRFIPQNYQPPTQHSNAYGTLPEPALITTEEHAYDNIPLVFTVKTTPIFGNTQNTETFHNIIFTRSLAESVEITSEGARYSVYKYNFIYYKEDSNGNPMLNDDDIRPLLNASTNQGAASSSASPITVGPGLAIPEQPEQQTGWKSYLPRFLGGTK